MPDPSFLRRIVSALCAGALAASLPATLAVGALALTPGTICACSTRIPSYFRDMREDLQRLDEVQAAFFADSARYATPEEVSAASLWLPSSSVTLVAFSSSDSVWRARVMHDRIELRGCQLTQAVAPWNLEEKDGGTVRCDPVEAGPIDPLHFQLLAWYAGFFVLAVFIRSVRVGGRLGPAGPGTYVGFLVLAVVHPFWLPMYKDAGCSDGMPIRVFAVIAMAVIAGAIALHDPRRAPRAAS